MTKAVETTPTPNKFAFEKLCMGEIGTVERLSNISVKKLNDEDTPQAMLLAAFAFVWKRRTEPSYTWNDAQALTMVEVNDILGLNDDDDEADGPKE